MDPNASLRRILEFCREIGHDTDATTREIELAETVEALHTWIVRGGALPILWRPMPTPHDS